MFRFSEKALVACLMIFMLCFIEVFDANANDQESGYQLGREDVLSITIMAGGETQAKSEMVVGVNGYINVPFIGKIQAAGKTIDEVEKAIVAPLAQDYFVDPMVQLQIKEYHSLQFFISGAVKKPGMFELDFIPRIMDLIAKAGGVLPDRGNLAYILRGVNDMQLSDQELDAMATRKHTTKAEPVKIDLIKLLDKGDMTGNIRLKSGDTVYIPLSTKLDQATTKVYVQGEVKKPGVLEYQPGMTALAACIMAGGFAKFAAPNRAKVIRKTEDGQETIKIDLEKVISGDSPDLPLKPGDRIHIPESWL